METDMYNGRSGVWFLALCKYAAVESEIEPLAAAASLLSANAFDTYNKRDLFLFEDAVRAERAIARRAVEAMRACGFERRRPKSYRGDEQELQMDYALEILLGLPQRGERRYQVTYKCGHEGAQM